MTIPKGSNGRDIFDVATSGHADWPHMPPQRDGRRRKADPQRRGKHGMVHKRPREIKKKGMNPLADVPLIIPSTYSQSRLACRTTQIVR
jgi:hypothetical protein